MIDLHVHTTASDGEFTPIEIIKMAKEINLDTIAITDHDTVDGLSEAINAGKEYGIDVIPGIEMKADHPHEMHILGYFIDFENENFKNFLHKQVEARIRRNEKYIEAFNNLGIDITFDEVAKIANSKEIILKPHFATLLFQKGYIKDVKEAYSKYFQTETFKKISLEKPSPKEVIEVINNSGGISVLAHPILMQEDDEKTKERIKELKSYGLMGLEVYHSDQSKEDSEKYLSWANEFDLIVTGGNDFHGEGVKPRLKLGTGYDNKNIITDDSIVCELKDKYDEIHNDKKYKEKRISSRGVIIHDGKVLTILRCKEKKEPYYTLPGGGREGNETLRNNIIREIKEEIDQNANVKTMFATYENIDSYQHFYEIDIDDYDNVHLGNGDGTEFIDPKRGSYEIAWLEIDKLKDYLLYPLEIRDKIIEKFYKDNGTKNYYIIKA